MKNVGIFLIIISVGFLIWFKFFKIHNHKVQTFKGLIRKDSTDIDPVKDKIFKFKFNEDPVFSFLDSVILKKVNGDSIEVYRFKYKIAVNTYGNHSEISGDFISSVDDYNQYLKLNKAHFSKGTYGCIPKFISDDQINIKREGNYIICLIARNQSGNVFLEPLKFEISETSYQDLNTLYQSDKNIEGGINWWSKNKMKIYNGDGTAANLIISN